MGYFVERRYGYLVDQLQADCGTEFTNKQLEEWLRAKGIHHRLCNVATPCKNGVVEKKKHALQKIIRSLLSDSGLGRGYLQPPLCWVVGTSFTSYK